MLGPLCMSENPSLKLGRNLEMTWSRDLILGTNRKLRYQVLEKTCYVMSHMKYNRACGQEHRPGARRAGSQTGSASYLTNLSVHNFCIWEIASITVLSTKSCWEMDRISRLKVIVCRP